MARYVDGFLLPVPKKNIEAYKRLAKKVAKVWKEHGALEYCECVGEDMKVKVGIPFPKLVNPAKGEVPVFAWIVYKSRAHRDAVNKKVMADPRLQKMVTTDMPFDCRKMAYGGFEVLVEA